MLILATRADQRTRYRLDLLNCLCYPEGIAGRFTYQRQWIDARLRGHALPADLSGLIVLCDPPDTGGAEYGFLPLRHVTIEAFEPPGFIEVQDENLYVGVRFVLGPYVNIGAGKSAEWRVEWQRWVEGYPDRPRPDDDSHQGPRRWLFPMEGFSEAPDPGSNETAWELIATEAGKSNALKTATLFRVSGLCPSNEVNCGSLPLVDYAGTKALEVRSGSSPILSLDFYLDPTKPAPPASLVSPRSTSPVLSISQPMFQTIGLSTRASIIVSCAQIYADDVAVMVIEDPEDQNAMAPRVEFPVRLRKKRGLLVWILVLLVLGALAAGLSPDTLKEIWSTGWIADNAATVSDVTKLVGSALVGVAGYLGFRRLPGS